MKRRHTGFTFRGFVALADTLFAVSAGLLLLNPVKFGDSKPEPKPAPAPAIAPVSIKALYSEMDLIEERLQKLEAENERVQRKSIEVLKNE